MDFLEHEVAELALFSGFGAVAILHGFALDSLAVNVPDLHAVAADFGDIAFFQVHEAVGDLTQGQLVGRQEVFPQAQADHQRAAAAGCNQAIRLLSADHCQAVSTVQLFDSCLEGHGQVAQILEFVVQQVSDDFGVGVRGEHITQGLELFTQGFVVFDDAVVHHRQVTGEMRVGIALARRTVGGPARVGNAQATDQRLGGQRLLQLTDLARTTHALEFFIVGVDRHASAVIPTVFEAFQAFDEDGGDVTFCDCADNSTHAISPD
ncbi:hypothetical protein D3C85_1247160 [compost metagenome]